MVRESTPQAVEKVLSDLPQECRSQIYAQPYRGAVIGRISYVIEPLENGKLRATSGYAFFSDTSRVRIFECDLN